MSITTTGTAITAEKLEERTSLVRRLRDSLQKQRDNLQKYVELLEKEEELIRSGNLEQLDYQVRFEQSIMSDIRSLQQVIGPLEELYSKTVSDADARIKTLQSSLERMKKRVLEKNEKNRILLMEKMDLLRQEIKSLRRSFHYSSPRTGITVPSVVDVST